MLETLTLYLVLGGCAGLIAGLLGVGGGVVIVPVLLFVFYSQGMPGDVVMHLALGTSLASIAVTGASSAWSHHRHGAIDWRLFGGMAPGLLLGALLGAVVADLLSGQSLSFLFGVFEVVVGVYMILGAPTVQRHAGEVLRLRELLPVGTGVGTVSALLGIGGGTLTVPYLTWRGRSIHRAVAVSSACGLPIALAGAVGYLITGLDAGNLPEMSLGYIYLPALLGMVAASLFSAPMGAKLAHKLPVAILRRLFGGVLLLVGISILVL